MPLEPFIFYCTDINPSAALASQSTLKQNNVAIGEVILSNFLDALSPRIFHTVDILLFNPPYVPSEDEEVRIALKQILLTVIIFI